MHMFGTSSIDSLYTAALGVYNYELDHTLILFATIGAGIIVVFLLWKLGKRFLGIGRRG